MVAAAPVGDAEPTTAPPAAWRSPSSRATRVDEEIGQRGIGS